MKKMLCSLILLLSIYTFAQDTYYTYHGKKIPLKADSSAVYVEFDNPGSAKLVHQKLTTAKLAGGSNVTSFGGGGLMFHNAREQFWNKAVSNEKNILFASPVLRTESSFIIPRPMIVLELKHKNNSINTVLKKYVLNDSKYESIGTGMYRITYINRSWQELLNICNTIAADKNMVNWCEPDFFAETKPTGPLYPSQYYLNNTGQFGGTAGIDIRAEGAWQISTGSGTIRVAVIDQGMDAHEDYAGRLLNGYTADNSGGIGAPQGEGDGLYKEHGVSCAGIIGATHNNGLGIKGVAPGVLLLPVNIFPYHWNILNPAGAASTASIALAIDWAVNQGAADVLNCAWKTASSSAIETSINNALTSGRNNRGCVVVFSSGNGGNTDVGFPAHMPGIITVGACDKNGAIWGYSQRGPSMDVVAPSGDIRIGSVFYGDVVTTDRMGTAGSSTDNYMTDFGGTSAAVPQVAGIAALLLSVNPNLTSQQVTALIQSTATDMGTAGYDNTFGFGRANACAALMATFNIAGPDYLCASESYSISGLPTGSIVTWGASVPGVISLAPAGNSVIATKIANGVVTLTATIANVCGGTTILNKTINVGLAEVVTISGPQFIVRNTTNNVYEALNPPAGVTLNSWSIVPSTHGTITSLGTDRIRLRPTVIGTIEIKLNGTTSCGTYTVGTYLVEVEPPSLLGFNISPNPAQNTVTIKLNETENSKVSGKSVKKPSGKQASAIKIISIYDIAGKLKNRQTITGSNAIQTDIDVSSLSTGTYIIEISDGKTKSTQKLFIQK